MWLIVRTGESRGESAEIGNDPLVVGRDASCDLVVSDAKVSRRHIELVAEEGGVRVRDLDSANGMFVDGARVAESLIVGDEQIQIGSSVLTVASEPAQGSDATVRGLSTVSALVGRGQSVVQRLALQRSVRRATILAATAIVLAAALGTLFAVGVLPPGSGQANAVERVVARAGPSTVLVEKHDGGRRVGTGTGWVLDGRRGLIVTNAHVINGGTSFRVGAANNLFDADVLAVAPCEDLAILRIRGGTSPPALVLGDQSRLRQGQTVVALGFPDNASLEADLTSTTGVVSVVRTSYRQPALDVPRYSDVIQTDAAVNPGNSGGPLLDLAGRVVGVNAAGRTLSGGRIIQGQSYAIGIDRVKEVTDVLRTGRSLGWSGVGLVYPSAGELRRRGAVTGLVAGPAVPGTGAARAKLGPPGALIVAVGGRRVGNSIASYCDAVIGIRSGAKVPFLVQRAGATRPVTIRVTMD